MPNTDWYYIDPLQTDYISVSFTGGAITTQSKADAKKIAEQLLLGRVQHDRIPDCAGIDCELCPLNGLPHVTDSAGRYLLAYFNEKYPLEVWNA